MTIKMSGSFGPITGAMKAGDLFVPPTVTDGLQLYLDAGDTSSYSGSGSTWTDLSGAGHNGTLNGPAFTGDSFSFDAVNDIVSIAPVLSAFPLSLSVWVTNDGGWGSTSGFFEIFNMSINGNRLSLGVWNLGLALLYGGAGHWVAPNPTTNVTPSDYHNITWTTPGYNNSGHRIYVDGVSSGPLTNLGGPHGGSAGWVIGSNSDSGQYYNGKMAVIQLYNKELSQAEVSQNVTHFGSRFY